jgi:hypothetical protein
MRRRLWRRVTRYHECRIPTCREARIPHTRVCTKHLLAGEVLS